MLMYRTQTYNDPSCFCHFSFTHRLKRLLLQLLRLSTLLMRNGWYVICYSLIVYLHLTSRTRNQRKKRRKQQQTVLLLSQLLIRLLTVAQLLLILVSALFKLLVALSVTFPYMHHHFICSLFLYTFPQESQSQLQSLFNHSHQ